MIFSDILSQHNVEMAPEDNEHARPGWLQFDCPFCEKDAGQYHMGYSLEGNYVNCYKCGYHSLISTVMELTEKSYHDCKKMLEGMEKQTWESKTVRGKLIIPDGVGELKRVHKKYLRSRNFDVKHIQKTWQIKGICMHATLSWRIFIPIIYHGEMVSWTTRSVSSDNPKRYMTAPKEQEAVPAKSLLYGEDYASSLHFSIIVCEGPLDVWRIGPGAVATMGMDYSQAQVEKIVEYTKRAICFDNEPDAQKRAQRLCNDIASFPGETFNVVLDGKDAAESSDKAIWKLRKMLL